MLEEDKKILIIAFVIVTFLFPVLLGLFIIHMRSMESSRLTDVGTEISPDGKYRIVFQAVGSADFPFGSSHAKATLYDGNVEILSFNEDIADDGAAFRTDNYCVEWLPYGVVITFMGSEQPDHEMALWYDGSDFVGYTDEEIEYILKMRYHIENVEILSRDNNRYRIESDGIVFYADNTMFLHDSYRQELVKAMTEEVFSEVIQRRLEWDKQEGATPADIVYTPIISMNSTEKQDIDSFCGDICKWLEYCFDKLPYEEGQDIYTGLIVAIPDYQNVTFHFTSHYWLKNFKEYNTDFYNSLNRYINKLDAVYNITDNNKTNDQTINE